MLLPHQRPRKQTINEIKVTLTPDHIPWNKGKLVGQKPPLKLPEIWTVRTRLRMAGKTCEIALFDLACCHPEWARSMSREDSTILCLGLRTIAISSFFNCSKELRPALTLLASFTNEHQILPSTFRKKTYAFLVRAKFINCD